jgi:hypothetical protein
MYLLFLPMCMISGVQRKMAFGPERSVTLPTSAFPNLNCGIADDSLARSSTFGSELFGMQAAPDGMPDNGNMQHWPDRRLLDLLNIESPIIQAPMAGSDSVALARSVSSAGALGSLACALLGSGANVN